MEVWDVGVDVGIGSDVGADVGADVGVDVGVRSLCQWRLRQSMQIIELNGIPVSAGSISPALVQGRSPTTRCSSKSPV